MRWQPPLAGIGFAASYIALMDAFLNSGGASGNLVGAKTAAWWLAVVPASVVLWFVVERPVRDGAAFGAGVGVAALAYVWMQSPTVVLEASHLGLKAVGGLLLLLTLFLAVPAAISVALAASAWWLRETLRRTVRRWGEPGR